MHVWIINYLLFIDDDIIIGKESLLYAIDFLEKNPLVDSEQYVATKDATNIRLNPDKEDRVKNLMDKMAKRVSLIFIFVYISQEKLLIGSCTSYTIISII